MDATRIHLFITHLPVFGLLLGFFALIYGLLRNDKGIKMVSLVMIVVSVGGGVIAFQTGEAAEETVDRISGIPEEAIEVHEESAELTNLLLIGLGILSAVSLLFELKNHRFGKPMMLAVLVLTVLTFYFVARTAALGGKIRHTEITTRSHGD